MKETRQWFGKNKDGQLIEERNVPWNMAKAELDSLSLNNNGQWIELPSGFEYIQGKTASASLSTGQSVIESRYIGFILGNNIVRIRVDEKSNNIRVEVTKHDITPEKPIN